MKNPYSVTLSDAQGDIALHVWLTPEQCDNLRARGYECDLLLTVIPEWAVECGLVPVWVFCSDLFNFRWKKLFSGGV